VASRGNYYELLGVSREASQEEIRRAYEIALNRAHRDGAFKHSEDLVRAYETLSDQRRRALYDRHGYEPIRERSPGAAPPPPPYRTTLAAGPRDGRPPSPARRRGRVGGRLGVFIISALAAVGIASIVRLATAGASHPPSRPSLGPALVVPMIHPAHPRQRVKVVCVSPSGTGKFTFRARPGTVVRCPNGATPTFR
jgi:hypothetical protein